MMEGMSYAHEAVRAYFARTSRPGDQALDAAYQFEMAVLRDMLDRLEVILDDEGVDRATAMRVIRCMLYGSPSPAAAELRIQQERRMVNLLEHIPPVPVDVSGLLGMPPP